jgi:Flp pilus assembly protein CpaB
MKKYLRVILIAVFSLAVGLVVVQALLFNTTSVLVAKVPIAVGTQVTADMVEAKQIHGDGVEPGAFKTLNDLKGAYAMTNIPAKGQVNKNNTSSDANPKNLSALVPAGQVGMMLPVNEINGFSRNLIPGDKIDILATLSTAKSATGKDTKDTIVVAENVPILSVEKTTDGKDVVGYQVAIDPQKAKDIHHILSTEDHQNNFAIRLLLSGYQNKQDIIPKSPEGDIVSRYVKAQ